MKCSHCNRDVPDGVFCTVCGNHEATTKQAGNSAKRVSHYAAFPGEHVFHPGIFTTLFPHLGQHKVHEFRWAFLAGVAAVFVLDVAGMVSAAILTAALLIPVLYLIYLYEAQVYRDAPATALGFTIGGGVVLGIIVTVIVDHFTSSAALGGPVGSDTGTLVTLCIVVPIVQERIASDPFSGKRPGGRIVVSTLGDDAVALGAVALAQQQEGRDPFAKSRRTLQQYPLLLATASGSVSVDGTTHDKDIYVRADGKVSRRAKLNTGEPRPLRYIHADELQGVCLGDAGVDGLLSTEAGGELEGLAAVVAE